MAEVTPGEPIVLGKTMPNSQILLLDSNGVNTIRGEMCISGPGLATGYFKDETLTQERFVDLNEVRFYKTGDYAKREQGELVFLGRTDHTVKNRGFLINLESEVTPALLSHPSVVSATALHINDKLFGFVTPLACEEQQIRCDLADTFNPFLVPDHIFSFESLPLNPNGKVDVQALRQKALDHSSSSVGHIKSSSSQEDVLISAVASSLGINLETCDRNASFWDLGGNSLSAIRALAMLREHGMSILISRLLSSDGLASLSNDMTTDPIEDSKANLDTLAEIPMTAIQQKMLSSSSRNPHLNHITLDMQVSFGLTETLVSTLRESLVSLLARHQILSCELDIEKQSMRRRQFCELDWQTIITTASEWENEGCRQMRMIHSLMQTCGPLNSTFRLIVAPGHRSRLLWPIHHSRIDGWSVKVLLQELRALLNGEALPKPSQFFHAALIQKSLHDQPSAAAFRFWDDVAIMGRAARPIKFPQSSRRELIDGICEAKLQIDMPNKQVREACRSMGISVSGLIYGAWALLLMRYSGSRTASFGAVFSGRNLPMTGSDSVVGPMINVCPFAAQWPEAIDKAHWLAQIQTRINSMSDIQWSLDTYLSHTTENSPLAHDSLISVQADLLDCSLSCQAIPARWELKAHQISEAPWTLLVEEVGNNINLRLLYRPEVTSLSGTARALTHLKNILSSLLDPQVISLDQAQDSIFSASERQALLQSHQEIAPLSDQGFNVKKAFECSADCFAHLNALESPSASMTYRELDRVANTLAWQLSAEVGPGSTVAVMSDGSIEWIIAILAIIKTGAAYCPIDINLSSARIEKMLRLSKSNAVVAPKETHLNLIHGRSGCRTFVVNQAIRESASCNEESLFSKASLDDPVCLIFTSGTSGSPKSVRPTSRGLLSYIAHGPARLNAGPGRRIAQTFSVGFDACAAEIFGTLCYGGTLLLKHSDDLLGNLRTADAAMMTPSFLSACEPADFPNLNTILLGGEAVPQVLADTWSTGRTLYNGYGPCECTVGSVFKQLSPQSEVTLGRPVPGLLVYVLSEERKPLPIGIEGEIYISGTQVIGRYFTCNEKDQGRFMPDPWHPGQMMFRTGDSGRWNDYMELEYVGRLDRQVKVRGFRINLEEVESVIRQASPRINQVAVVVSMGSLVACLSPETVDEQQIAAQLRQMLPYFSVPSRFVKMDKLPLTANQKIDLRACASLESTQVRPAIPPSTKLATLVANTWGEVLKSEMKGESSAFSLEDDFLQLGGHSLLQLQLTRKLSAYLKCNIPLRAIMTNTVLSDQAEALQKVISDSPSRQSMLDWKAKSLGYSDSLVSSSEEEIMLLSNEQSFKSAFNMPCLFRIDGGLDLNSLISAISRTIEANAALRTRFRCHNGKLMRETVHAASLLDIRAVSTLDQATIDVEVNKVFDFEHSQLLRLVLFMTGVGISHLLIVAHHSIMDGAALGLFFSQIQREYEHAQRNFRDLGCAQDSSSDQSNTPTRNAKPSPDYLDWIAWQSREPEDNKRLFWKQYLHELPQPLFAAKPSLANNEGRVLTQATTTILFQAIKNTCSRVRISEQQLFLSAVALSFSGAYDRKDIVTAIPCSRREEPGSEEIIGLLLDRLPVRLRQDQDSQSCGDFLQDVRANSEQGLVNYIPYLQICDAVGAQSQLFDVMVSYHPRSSELTLDLPRCKIEARRLRPRGAKFPCMFEVFEEDGCFRLDIEHMVNLISHEEVSVLASLFSNALELLCRDTNGTEPQAAETVGKIIEGLSASASKLRLAKS
ncbi:MAG: hypothetical protein MMC23_007958 [Stictis urceolatum]|nr:hypothetical protein [Stictis urceolata]